MFKKVISLCRYQIICIFLFNLIIIALPKYGFSQITVEGVVTSATDGTPLPGTNVGIQGTSNGTSTDANGHYELEVESADAVLVFSFIGYIPQKIRVGNKRTINVVLKSEVAQLENLVVVGYGAQEEGVLTSSITTIRAEAIENVSVVSPSELLQGRTSGVQVSSTSGAPGAGLRIKIRGTTSISGSSEPLYIVDGVPIQTGSFGLGTGGATTSAMAYLDPDDIESISVLKDASATAIYGARAANGVVIITTKRGANQPVQVQFSTSFGISQAVNTPDLVSGSQFEMLQNEAARLNGESIPYANPEQATNTDWADFVFRNGSVRNYDMSISGGNEKIKYSISGGHFFQEGITKPMLFKRSAARVNLDLNVSEDLKVGTSISYTNSHRNRGRNNDAIHGILSGAYFYPSNLPVYQENGDYTHYSILENPVATTKEVDFDMNVDRFIGNFFTQYDISTNLSAKASWSYDFMLINTKRYNTTNSVDGSAVNGMALSSYAANRRWTAEITLNYIANINDHNFNILVGGSLEERDFTNTQAQGQQFPSNDFRFIDAAAIQTATSSGIATGLMSLFGRVQYDYDRRYLATLTVRRDASSRFGENNQWGTFPSIGLGWVISQESFFNVDWISNLKFRASFGITGNQGGIGAYQSLGLWTGTNYGDKPGTATNQLANPDLKWETTRQLDIGVDMDLFGGRVNITYDYFSKYTTDLLLAVPVPSTTGYQTLVQNFGELSNKGMEFSIGADIIQGEDFNWNATFNIAGNRNLIEELASPFNVYNRSPYRYMEGIPMFSFYMHKQTGVDPQTGDIIFADVNNDGEFTINGDRTIVGDANPDFFGGLRNTINYQQFSLAFFIYYEYGSKQLNWNRFFQEHGGTRSNNFLASQLDRWQEPGDITNIPKMTSENYKAGFRPSRFVEDGSYIRLKNVTLTYTFPTSISESLGIRGAQIYVTGQNLITITKYSGLDPEVTGTASSTLTKGIEFYTIPHAKSYLVGFNINF